jgi:hypothetical protein
MYDPFSLALPSASNTARPAPHDRLGSPSPRYSTSTNCANSAAGTDAKDDDGSDVSPINARL